MEAFTGTPASFYIRDKVVYKNNKKLIIKTADFDLKTLIDGWFDTRIVRRPGYKYALQFIDDRLVITETPFTVHERVFTYGKTEVLEHDTTTFITGMATTVDDILNVLSGKDGMKYLRAIPRFENVDLRDFIYMCKIAVHARVVNPLVRSLFYRREMTLDELYLLCKIEVPSHVKNYLEDSTVGKHINERDGTTWHYYNDMMNIRRRTFPVPIMGAPRTVERQELYTGI
jgi:hypothetical protein